MFALVTMRNIHSSTKHIILFSKRAHWCHSKYYKPLKTQSGKRFGEGNPQLTVFVLRCSILVFCMKTLSGCNNWGGCYRQCKEMYCTPFLDCKSGQKTDHSSEHRNSVQPYTHKSVLLLYTPVDYHRNNVNSPAAAMLCTGIVVNQ